MILKYKIKETDTYRIIKEVLKSYFQISDRLLLKLKRNEKIFLNSEKSYVYSSVKANDIVEVFLDFDEDNSNIVPTKMNLDILYEDECYLIINKAPLKLSIFSSRASIAFSSSLLITSFEYRRLFSFPRIDWQ